MDPGLLLPLALTVLFATGFVVNEWSGGGLAASMGLGNHHVLAVAEPCPTEHAGPHLHATCGPPPGGAEAGGAA